MKLAKIYRGGVVEKHIKDIDDLVPNVRSGVKQLNESNPRAAHTVLAERSKAIRDGNGPAKEFTEKILASGQRIDNPGEVKRAMEAHSNLRDRATSIPGVSYNGKVSRGVLEKIEVNGQTIINTPDSVFAVHAGQKLANNRFSIGGDLGNSGLYVAMGVLEDTKYALSGELKAGGKIIFGETSIELNNLLDLTDAATLNRLDLNFSDLRSGYLVPQAVGDAAVTLGYDGIIFNSAITEGVKNIAIFK